jgi:hypothetical protein
MEPKPEFRSDKRASLEFESAQRALGDALFWWKEVLAAERASEWKPFDPVAAGASTKGY